MGSASQIFGQNGPPFFWGSRETHLTNLQKYCGDTQQIFGFEGSKLKVFHKNVVGSGPSDNAKLAEEGGGEGGREGGGKGGG